MPEIPAIQIQETQPISPTLMRSFLWWRSLQIAPVQRFQFSSLLLLPALDQIP
jgi:hypothetical protein